MSNLNRREFLKTSTALATGLTVGGSQQLLPAEQTEENTTLPPNTFRERLLECLGGPWPKGGDLRPKVEQTSKKQGYRLERVSYEVESKDRVPAYLLIPDGVTATSPAPAVAVWHQHNGQWHLGKSEPAGLSGNPMHHTGVALAKLGYVVLCPDALCFEDRQDPDKKLKGGAYERFEFLRLVMAGCSMAWKNILDMRRAVDYLVTRPEVKPKVLGCYGHSMGSTHAWLVGPWERRLKCVIGNCCFPTYPAINRKKLLHCFPNFIPGLSQYGDTPDIAALIAPRALHLNFGENDGGSPIQEVRQGIKTIAKAYNAIGASEQFTWFIEKDTGHVLSKAMWQHVQSVLAKQLSHA